MPKTSVGSVEICYETHGDAGGVPLLLIMGLASQLVAWDDDFVQLLVDHGYYVIRYDNRDVGQSTHMSHLPAQNIMQSIMLATSGQPVDAPYSLVDMAHDALGLLDALKLDSVHVVGVSMGGMIAQCIALLAPQRVRSLTSIMSTTNDRGLPPPEPRAMAALAMVTSGEAGPNRLQLAVSAMAALSGEGYPCDEQRMAKRLKLSLERGFSPAGVARQFLAILTATGRGESLRSLKIPTLVIHGESDPLVPTASGRATAAAIPGAKLITIPGMGHDLPVPLFSTITSAISEHVDAVEKSSHNAAN